MFFFIVRKGRGETGNRKKSVRTQYMTVTRFLLVSLEDVVHPVGECCGCRTRTDVWG